MTHGVIINGETYVNVDYPSDKLACNECDLGVSRCSAKLKKDMPCIPLKTLRRVIFIQPTQTKKDQAK